MTDYYEERARTQRAPRLQQMLDSIATNTGIDPDFIAASDHPYMCRCRKCLAWWSAIGPDGEPDDLGAWGPFTKEEVETYRHEL